MLDLRCTHISSWLLHARCTLDILVSPACPRMRALCAFVCAPQINMPEPYSDHFQPLMFEMLSKDKPPVNLLPHLDFDRVK